MGAYHLVFSANTMERKLRPRNISDFVKWFVKFQSVRSNRNRGTTYKGCPTIPVGITEKTTIPFYFQPELPIF